MQLEYLCSSANWAFQHVSALHYLLDPIGICGWLQVSWRPGADPTAQLTRNWVRLLAEVAEEKNRNWTKWAATFRIF